MTLKYRYQKEFKSQSTNESVLKLYAHILEHQNSDSDIWTSGGEFKKLVDLLKYFNEADWSELKLDLPFWTTLQLEIFTEGILTGDEWVSNLDELDLISIQKRTELIPELITISQNPSRQHNDISLYVQENIEFIRKGKPKSLHVLEKIRDWDNQLDWFTSNRQKAKSPNAEIIELEIKRAVDNTM